MLDIMDGDRHRLLQQPVLLELVRIYERADKTAIGILVRAIILFILGGVRGFRPGERSAFVGRRGGICTRRVWVAGLERPLTPLRRSLLLAGRERTVELAVDEEIGENAARAPGNAIRPSLNAGCSLFVHKDVAAHDELVALSVVRTAETVGQGAAEARFKNDQRVFSGLDVAPPCGHTRRGLAHTHIAEGVCLFFHK